MLLPVLDMQHATFSLLFFLGEKQNHKNVKKQLQIDKGNPDEKVVKTKVSRRKYLGCSFIISDKSLFKIKKKSLFQILFMGHF